MGNLVGGVIALVVGAALATGTVIGVVSSQTAAGNQPVSGNVLDYGTNNQ